MYVAFCLLSFLAWYITFLVRHFPCSGQSRLVLQLHPGSCKRQKLHILSVTQLPTVGTGLTLHEVSNMCTGIRISGRNISYALHNRNLRQCRHVDMISLLLLNAAFCVSPNVVHRKHRLVVLL